MGQATFWIQMKPQFLHVLDVCKHKCLSASPASLPSMLWKEKSTVCPLTSTEPPRLGLVSYEVGVNKPLWEKFGTLCLRILSVRSETSWCLIRLSCARSAEPWREQVRGLTQSSNFAELMHFKRLIGKEETALVCFCHPLFSCDQEGMTRAAKSMLENGTFSILHGRAALLSMT